MYMYSYACYISHYLQTRTSNLQLHLQWCWEERIRHRSQWGLWEAVWQIKQ